ncbi:uncharacterized protein MELLADRAFT_114098 [Melampsora larici-populina 98AG31]|uniref:Uncharacterized protein n=1 Tax=Melampsora larici-populina (strain 98AG31 / pathotype 3-4-7) TaxID=747676 RepID=F4SC61_MELLP|nr:uncharacterized protein MELLADRAFT_114098 [Melampsora larici-populina 98AG31]EGF97773.1 hypothetical protein MELLADRAFT_114098 [Melampsora larici-populina 98AG31]
MALDLDANDNSDDDGITQTAATPTPKPRSFSKKPAPRVRPNTKAKLATSLDNSADLLKTQATQAIQREKLKADAIAAHDAAKEQILVTAAQLDRESLTFKFTAVPSQDKALEIFNKSWREHFDDTAAATEAILLFEQEDKCRTFINSDPELRWSWLALSLGYRIVPNVQDGGQAA